MNRLINKTLKGTLAIGTLACTTVVQANALAPKVTIHHQQISNDQVNVEVGLQDLSDQVVALEVSFIADDITDILGIDTSLNGGYATYKLSSMSDQKEKVTYYIVSNDQETPLILDNGSLANFNFKTTGKLIFDMDSFSVKVIEKGYNTYTYDNVEMIYSESDDNSNDKPGVDVPEIDKPDVDVPEIDKPEVDKPEIDVPEVDKPETDKPGVDETLDNSGSSSSGNGSGSSSSSGSGNTSGDTITIKPNPEAESNNNGNISNSSPDYTQDINFTDIKNHWASDAITNMANKGVIKGYEDGSFKPSATITRGEFAALLARAFDIQNTGSTSPFKDVQTDKWYTDSIVALHNSGIVTGRADGTFGVSEAITNEEICTMIYRTLQALQIQVPETNPSGIQFTDENNISSYAKAAVSALTKAEVIKGQPDGSFGPKSSTIRAQVAVMLDRLLTSLG